jgi:acetylglutamate kinase
MRLPTATVIDTLKYVRQFSGQRILIKLGGSILDDVKLVAALCEDLSLLRAANISLLIVHGGSKAIDKNLEAHKLSWEFHEGQRITTPEMVNIIEMVLCGHVNKMLVRTLNAVGVPAVGLSGSDEKMLQCGYYDEILGEVGYIEQVDTTLLEMYLQQQAQSLQGAIPVVAPIGVNQNGNALNVNADWAATRIAQALAINKLIYLTDQDGIYDEQGTIISQVDAAQLEELIETKVVKNGMLTKCKTILSALNEGIDNIHIINAKQPNALIQELFTNQGVGTICKKRATL